MGKSVTIRLDEDLESALSLVMARTGRTRSEVVRDALRRQLALQEFRELRTQLLPYAEARNLLTDEDIFAIIS